MSANAIIRWLLSTGRTYTTVGKLQAALVEQIVEYVPVDRLWCGTTVLHPQAAAYLWVWQRDSPPKERELGYAQFAQMEENDSPARRLKHGADHVRYRDGTVGCGRATWDEWTLRRDGIAGRDTPAIGPGSPGRAVRRCLAS